MAAQARVAGFVSHRPPMRLHHPSLGQDLESRPALSARRWPPCGEHGYADLDGLVGCVDCGGGLGCPPRRRGSIEAAVFASFLLLFLTGGNLSEGASGGWIEMDPCVLERWARGCSRRPTRTTRQDSFPRTSPRLPLYVYGRRGRYLFAATEAAAVGLIGSHSVVPGLPVGVVSLSQSSRPRRPSDYLARLGDITAKSSRDLILTFPNQARRQRRLAGAEGSRIFPNSKPRKEEDADCVLRLMALSGNIYNVLRISHPPPCPGVEALD